MPGSRGRWRETSLKCTLPTATGILFCLEKMEPPQYCPSTGYTTEMSSTLLRILVASTCSLCPWEEFHPTKPIGTLRQVSAGVECSTKEMEVGSLEVVAFLILAIMNTLRLS